MSQQSEELLKQLDKMREKLAPILSAREAKNSLTSNVSFSVKFSTQHQVGFGFVEAWAIVDHEGYVVGGSPDDTMDRGMSPLIFKTKKAAEDALTKLLIIFSQNYNEPSGFKYQ